MASPIKAQTPEASAGAEWATMRDTGAVRNGGAVAAAADPTERLQQSAGNRAVNALLARPPAAGAGVALPRRLRSEMEARFSEDFGAVRLYFGAPAEKAAAVLRAKAYTLGADIVFANRGYAPDTFEGRRLLAHELAHVVQQRRGGMTPELRRGAALEQSAEQAARAVVNGAAAIAVGGGSSVGVAREGTGDDDEIARALSTWTHFDQETPEEARHKPAPSQRREAAANTPAATAPPGKSDETGNPLLKRSQALRERRQDLLDRRKQALEKGEDPRKLKPRQLPPGERIGKYQAAVRAATRREGQDEVDRHAAAVRGQQGMTPEDMYNKTLAMRGGPAGAAVWERQRLQEEYDGLKKKLEENPQTAAILGLERQNEALQAEIGKLDQVNRKQGGLATEDKERVGKLKATLAANEETIKHSEVAALRARANRLAISGLRDPNAAKDATGAAAASKGAPAGWDKNTHAIVQVLDKNGKMVAWGIGTNDEHGHAEENALAQIRQQIKRMGGKLPPGMRVEVVGDQVVCPSVCRKALSEFATEHHVDSVDGYTFRAHKATDKVKPGGDPLETAKNTALNAATAEATDAKLEREHLPIYRRGTGRVDPDPAGSGDEHRHEHQEDKRKAKKRAAQRSPKVNPGTKGPAKRAGHGQSSKPTAKAAAPAKPAKPTGRNKASARPAKTPAKGKAPSAPGAPAATPARRKAAPTGSPPPAKPAVSRKASKQSKAAPRTAVATPKKTKAAAKKAPAPSRKAAGAANPGNAVPRAVAPRRKAGPKATAPKSAAPPRIQPNTKPARQPAKRPRSGSGPTAAPASPQGKALAKPSSPKSAPRRPGRAKPASARTVSTTRGGSTFLAPNTMGATANFGVQAQREHGKGVTTGQSIGFDGTVAIDVTEIPGSDPLQYQVTLQINLSGQLTAEANKQSTGGRAKAGASLTASGSLARTYSYQMSADAAAQYRAAAESGTGGTRAELEVVRLLANDQIEAAREMLEKHVAQTGTADAARHFGKGQAVETTLQGTVGGDVSAGGEHSPDGSLGIKFGLFRTGSVTRRVEERDGKIVVTMTVEAGTGGTFGGSLSEGFAGFGAGHSGEESRLRGVSFTLDPTKPEFDAQFNAISAVGSIDALDRMRAAHPNLAGATTTGTGEAHQDEVGGSLFGAGLTFSQGGTRREQQTRDERGVSYHNEATSTVGLKATAGDHAIATSSQTDSLVTDIGPDNQGSGETRSTRRESDLGRSASALRKSFAKHPVTTATGVVTGKLPVLQERVDSSGKAITDDSFTRLAALAEDGRAWDHAWVAGHGDLIEWRKTRHRILAAHGDRQAIARALDQFSDQGELTSLTLEKAIGDTGIAFEFPDTIADQKPIYDALIVGNPVSQARELAERGQSEAAVNELNAANDKLGKLVAAVTAHQGDIQNQAKLSEMLNRVSDRRAQLRDEIRQINRVAKPRAEEPAPRPDIGLPTPEQAADEADRQAKLADLRTAEGELQGICMANRGKETQAFGWVRQELDTWHVFSPKADIMNRLNDVRNSWDEWDKTVARLKTVYKELGLDPASADALGPDRKQWAAVDGMW